MAHHHKTEPAALATFAAWLAARQECALQGMQTTTGKAFGLHCEAFTALSTAHYLVQQFEGEQGTQSPLCTLTVGRA